MKIKIAPISFFLFGTFFAFSQQVSDTTKIATQEIKISYLDSIKKTFVKNTSASRVDSLWMKELASLDTYNDITKDIQTINTDQSVDFELPTELLKERLKAMDAKSPFNIEYNPGLENIIKSFLKNRKKSFERLMGISEYYFPLFEEALAKQNVPLEIKYLAVVESSLNPKAVSRVGATGLWQFMYQTGKQYNLHVDSYVDERSDPLKASEAAAKYMTNMYAIFKDWELVLAAYNSGAGNVSKAIRRSGQQNFWNIRKNLPRETQGYVPAFLATMYIYEYHKEHGIMPNRALFKHFETDTVMVKKQMTFKQISDLLDIPETQLELLNPSYKRNVVPFYNDKNHFLRLPQDKIAVFTSNETPIYAYLDHELDKREKPFVKPIKAIIDQTVVAENDTISTETKKTVVTKTKFYRVQRGDNLTAIAEKYEVDIADLKKWNRLRSNTVPYGRSLKIVATDTVIKRVRKNTNPETIPTEVVDSQKVALAEAKSTKEEKVLKTLKTETIQEQTGDFYIVQKGDNLITIANKYNITVAQLKEMNNLSGLNVKSGSAIIITQNEDAKKEIAALPQPKNIEYVVVKGDNLSNISRKFGVSLEDLKLWNTIKNNSVALGSTLIIAKNEAAIISTNEKINAFKKKEITASVSKKEISYYVKKGDSLYSISKKYPGVTISDIKKWNDISDEGIRPGMKLKING
jgi:membrane-bound lytic murein transglycosylase D